MDKIETLYCTICFELPDDCPLTSSCCGAVFCDVCILQLREINKNKIACPACRNSTPSFDKNMFLLRMINQTKMKCKYGCGKILEGSEMKKHQKECIKRQISCQYCEYKGLKEGFLKHSIEAHSDIVIKSLEKSSEKQVKVINSITKNSKGHIATIGIIPKFYCGQQAGHSCQNCNSICGPSDGCNCPPCMQLDLIHRKLPKGCLVNSAGRTAFYKSGQFYCGVAINNGINCGQNQVCDRCKVLYSDYQYYRHLL